MDIARAGAPARRMTAALAAATLATGANALPLARIVAPGDPLDPATAYVVLLPHVTVLKERLSEADGILVGKTPDGHEQLYAVAVPADRPTVVGVAPGRYWFARIYSGQRYWTLEENDSEFDAKPRQLNYPGDWVVDVSFHDIVRRAVTIGYRISGTLTVGGGSADIAPLGLDPAFAALPLVQTHLEPAGHATGFGER